MMLNQRFRNMMSVINLYLATKVALRATLICLIFSSSAYAYVDPGSALLLLQGLFASIGAALVFIKKPWGLIAKLFSRNKLKDKNIDA